MKHLSRFSIRTVLITIGLIAFFLGWVVRNKQSYHYELSLIEKLSSQGSPVRIIDSTHPAPFPFSFMPTPQPTAVRKSAWPYSAFPRFLHPEIFERVDCVNYYGFAVSDEMLETISEFEYVTYLQLPENAVSESVISKYKHKHPMTKVVIGLDLDLNKAKEVTTN